MWYCPLNSIFFDFIKISIEFSETFLVKGDALHLRQLLFNIVKNAIKFSPQNTTINIVCTRDDLHTNTINIDITDQGPGVPLTELENIFKSNFRLKRDKSIEGSGLGLSFCREICMAHGGHINASSDGKSGTTFHISLPIIVDKFDWEKTEHTSYKKSIALVEDSVDVTQLISLQLKEIGIQVIPFQVSVSLCLR